MKLIKLNLKKSKTLSSNKSGYTFIGISAFSFFGNKQKLGIPVAQVFQKY